MLLKLKLQDKKKRNTRNVSEDQSVSSLVMQPKRVLHANNDFLSFHIVFLTGWSAVIHLHQHTHYCKAYALHTYSRVVLPWHDCLQDVFKKKKQR